MKRAIQTFAAATLATLALAPSAGAETYKSEHYTLRAVTVARGLEYPWGLAFLPDGGMIVTEREGRIRLVAKDGKLSPPLENVPKVYDSGQGGMLDIALGPDFPRDQTIYFSYAEPGSGGAGTAVARARLDRAENHLTNLKVIFRQQPKTTGGRHFGSRLVFARDGKLFITVGERGERDRAQDFSINRGQVIRINSDGSIPADNPFVGKTGYRPEVWSYGHRNPQGAALHPESGKLWTIEHGAQGGDEINIPRAGRNYGWPIIAYGRHYSGEPIGEGTHKSGLEQPIHYWDPSIAPSGMVFYTGDKFPKWKGSLLVGALKFQLVSRLELNGEKIIREERMLNELGERIRDVRQGPDGFVYLLTDSGDGRILRIEPAGP
ncbi:MAG: PQQ-dependent sugar dehydrogenase [Rhodospirillales bacterium]|nr:PQQ-dependent sugar dehydrogenase [Rhodospirillales bacterium]